MLRLEEQLIRRAERGHAIGVDALIERVESELATGARRAEPPRTPRPERRYRWYRRPVVIATGVLLLALALAVPLLFLGGDEPVTSETSPVTTGPSITEPTSPGDDTVTTLLPPEPDTAPTLAPVESEEPAGELPTVWRRSVLPVEGSGETFVTAVAEGGARLAALGVANPGCRDFRPSACPVPIVSWTSTDGVAWTRQALDDSVFGGHAEIGEMASDGTRIVAVGAISRIDEEVSWVNPDGEGFEWSPEDPVVWWSDDGIEWTRIILDAGVEDARLGHVAYGPAGYVALGYLDRYKLDADTRSETCGGEPYTGGVCFGDLVTWTSPDGIEWSQHRPDIRGRVNAIEAVADGYLAGGSRSTASCALGVDGYEWCDRAPVIWHSPDGVNWTEMAELPGTTPGSPFEANHVWRMTSHGPVVLAQGARSVTTLNESGEVVDNSWSPALWRSSNGGLTWSTLDPAQVFPGTGLPDDFFITGGAGGFVAAGSWPPNLSTSADGLSWTTVDAPLTDDDFPIGGVAVGPHYFFYGIAGEAGGMIISGTGG